MTDLLNPTEADLPQIDENKNYLTELVGEGKKFPSNEELAKGKWHSDQMIALQNKRLDELQAYTLELRKENTAKANLADYVDKLVKLQSTSNEHTQVNEDNQQPAFKPEDIENLISTRLQSHETQKKATENLNSFKAKLTERFGTNEAALNQQIESLGLDKEDLVTLAKKSPNAAIQMLGLNQKSGESFQSPPTSGKRSDNFAPSSAKKRSWTYYQEQKKTNKDWLYDRKFMNDMAKDAVELGDAFYDGDFYSPGVHER